MCDGGGDEELLFNEYGIGAWSDIKVQEMVCSNIGSLNTTNALISNISLYYNNILPKQKAKDSGNLVVS